MRKNKKTNDRGDTRPYERKTPQQEQSPKKPS